MFREITSYENYLSIVYNYLRPCSAGATVKNIKNALYALEIVRGKKIELVPWETIRDLFVQSDSYEEKNELRTKLLEKYKNKSKKKLPRSKMALAKEIWKMLIADKLVSQKLFRASPTLDPIPDETSENRYIDSDSD